MLHLPAYSTLCTSYQLMLNWIKKRVAKVARAGKPTHSAPLPSASVLAPAQHGIPENKISSNAMRVIERLHEAGYAAYIVGGGVRDMLLDLRPKDFDVATDATPEQVRQVFRHSRIIGRRFRIVHVMFGRDMIEVTTFRGHHSNAESARDGEAHDSGLLLRDNVYGSIEEDAIRRDFTVNALYYGVDHQVRDYCNGMRDIQKRLIHIIGDPETRYREDPVRMLRAVRLAAKLNFTIEKSTATPIARLAPLLNDISNARLFDEMIKLFMGGCAVKTFELLYEHKLFQTMFPGPARLLEPNNYSDTLIRQALANTDDRIRRDLRVTPAFLCAAILWPALQQQKQHAEHEGLPPHQALQKAAQKVISEQVKRIGIPKRFTLPMQEIWDLQWQLTRRTGGRAERALEHPRFRAAYDFLLLREQAGEDLHGLGQWWTAYQEADAEQRQHLQNDANSSQDAGTRKPRRRNNRNRRPPAASSD
jgi:poly(A) polymerase